MNQPDKVHNDGVLRIAEYETWLNASGISDHTRRAYISRMRGFGAFVNSSAGCQVAESLESAVLSYVLQLRKGAKANASIRGFLVAIKSYCKFRNIAQPRLKVSSLARSEVRVLSPAHQHRLLQILGAECSDRDRALVAFVLLCGLRTGECERLNLSDISSDGRTLYVAIRNQSGIVDRSIPLSSVTRRYAAAWIIQRREMRDTASDALFLSSKGKRLHANSIRWLIGNLGRMMGAELNPQMLRGSFITNLVSKSDDLDIVGELSGIRSANRIGHFFPRSGSLDKVAAVELACADLACAQVM